MLEYNCLICNEETRTFKDWNNYRINICETCKFSFIKITKAEKNEVFLHQKKNFMKMQFLGTKKEQNYLQRI